MTAQHFSGSTRTFGSPMLTCPICDTPNADGSVSCEHCNCAFSVANGETVLSNDLPDAQQTVLATGAFSLPTGGAAPARASSSELPPGHVLNGRYEIVARIGQGGMGTVYKAVDYELDQLIALKTIRPDLASNAAALRRLKQETLLARQIAHRNVIRVFDLGVAEGLRFITMEFVEGYDLKSLFEEGGKMPLEDALAIFNQICQGLAAAHHEDVVHRDLKPQNVLLSPDGRARIVDFGLARSFQDTAVTHTGAILGTPAYMAPEQALGNQGDVRSDIFSLGVIAFELFTSELPFPNSSLSESLISRTRGRARSIESVDPATPSWLARIVMRCLERDPSDRFATVGDVIAALRARDQADSPPLTALSGVLAPGTMVGSRYRIEAEAGEGGMGKVYRATDLDLHRTVALKVVRPELADNPQMLDQLVQEISIASRISHKNVLRIHDLGEVDGLRFVSMAWAEGEDLRSLLRRTGPLPEERIFELAIEICEGLQAAHEQGISHRDLKPSNILLTSGGHPCIADFGLARTLDSQIAGVDTPSLSSLANGHSAYSSGTPRYMSPEQVDGGAAIDHRTDIYSLGLILFEMATGRIPFDDLSAFQTMTQRLTEKAVSPRLLNPAISDHLAAISLRCLEQDPENRYANVADLLSALRAKPELALTHITEIPQPKASSKKSTLWLAWGVAIVAIIVAVLGARWYLRMRLLEPPSSGKYIAVLPFRAIGPDPNLKYRAEGIADAVSERLSSLSSVHPVSASALEQVSLNQSPEKIGRQVGANLLVQGTVQSQGDRIKVNASIFDIEKHKAIWNRPYEGFSEDLFTLEDRISSDTEKALHVTPTLEESERATPVPTQNLAAYDLYLKGRDILKNHPDPANAKAALALFEQARNRDDSFALAWTGVADASLLLYRLTNDSLAASKALAAAEEARNRNGNLPEVHFALGSVYSATGRNAEAVSEIKHALQLSPNSDDGYIRLGRAYLATGQKQAGLNALRKAVQLNTYYWRNHRQLGVALYNSGQTDEALKEFQEQVTLNPTEESGFNNIGSVYLGKAQWKKAIPEFQKAIKIHPTYEEYSNLATAYYHLGRYDDAIPIYQQAVKLEPNQPEAVRNLAEAYAHSGQKERAISAFDQAISLLYQELSINPLNANATGTLALCYAAKGNTAKARSMIAQARSIDSANTDLMYDEATINVADGRIPEALKALTRAFENGSSFEAFLIDPDMKVIRDSPGFAALKKQFAHTAEARR